MVLHSFERINKIANALSCGRGGCSCAKEQKPGQWLTHCPAHDDQTPSLSLTQSPDGRLLAHCFGGCSQSAVISALKSRGLWPGANGDRPQTAPVRPKQGQVRSDGLTLAEFAQRKKLDLSFLRQFGVSEAAGRGGRHYVVFQYRDLDDKPLDQAARFRFSMDEKPKCKRRGKPHLYGLWRLPEFRKGGEVLLLEGESDCLTAWQHGLPAVGIPGKGLLKTLDHSFFRGCRCVYVWQEPDAPELPGKVAARLREVDGLTVKALIPPDGIKDISEAHCRGLDVPSLLEKMKAEAVEVPEAEATEGGGRKTSKRKKEDVDDRTLPVSFFDAGDVLYEQITHDGSPAFIAYNIETGATEVATRVPVAELVYVPLGGDDLMAVSLPDGATEYGTTADLLREIEAYIDRYLDVSARYRRFASYYVILSWLFDRFQTIPYLRALGDTGVGKSRFLDVIGGVCYKPIMASGCVTPAPIYRMLRRWGGTLVLDEADIRNSDEYNEVVTILNCGFERGRPVLRATKDNPDKVQVLPVYGPKVFATRRTFQDKALEARCLTEIMKETSRDDIPAVLGTVFRAEQAALRSKLLLFRLRNYRGINPEAGDGVRLPVEPRLRQVSAAFISLFAQDEQALSEFTGFIIDHQRELIEQRASTLAGQVAIQLITAVESETLETLETHETGERVLNLSASDLFDNAEIKPQKVGSILKSLGVRTKPMRVDGHTKRCIVYDGNLFKLLKKRYFPFDGEGGVTCVSSVSTVSDSTTDKKRVAPRKVVI